ncbi:unnamed protein product, partial [Prorocentrum cordatum]
PPVRPRHLRCRAATAAGGARTLLLLLALAAGSPCAAVASSAYRLDCGQTFQPSAFLAEASYPVSCPVNCGAEDVAVYGTDYYASESAVCPAAVHQGVIGNGGGTLLVKLQKDGVSLCFNGTAQNGVSSRACNCCDGCG